jgi:pimeloyl-ACP methyl ester carboxylesterase
LTGNKTVAFAALLLLCVCCTDKRAATGKAAKPSSQSHEEPQMDKTNAQIDDALSAIFHPRPDMPYGPEASVARDHIFEVEDGVRLRMRLFLGDPKAPNILFFHGNGETARDYDFMSDMYLALPASFIVGEYRGYGPSTGTPTVRNLLTDAHKELDEVKRLLAEAGHTGPIVVMGRSLGSAPAIELAGSRSDEVRGLIIESGFARMLPLLELLHIPHRSLHITEEDGPRNQQKMAAITMPTLILHAENDSIISIADGELLYKANKDPEKVFIRVPNADHNDIQIHAGKAYFVAINNLLARVQ